MAILPISQAGAKDQLTLGQPSVSNAASEILVKGLSSPLLKLPIVSHWAGDSLSSLSLTLNLNLLGQEVNSAAIRFVFDGAIVQSKIGAGVQSKYGLPKISMSGFKVGVESLEVTSNLTTTPLIYALPQKPIDFALNDSFTSVSSKNLSFHYGAILAPNTGLGDTSLFGAPTIKEAGLSAAPLSINPTKQSSQPLVFSPTSSRYIISFNLSAERDNSFSGRFNFGGAAPIVNAGNINNGLFGNAGVKEGSPPLRPVSIRSNVTISAPVIYGKDPRDLQKNYGLINLDLLYGVNPSNAVNIPFNFWKDNQVSTGGFQSSAFGVASLANEREYLSPYAWQSSKFGLIEIVNTVTVVKPTAFIDGVFGKPTAINTAEQIKLIGINSLSIGGHLTYNLKQFAPLQGKDQSSYGTPYMQGGVRWVKPIAIEPPTINRPVVTNTTANQYAYPTGIARTASVPAPIVSPHMIYAGGIYSTALGSVKVIPTPVLRHKGVNHMVGGTPTVWYHTRAIGAKGFESYETGYPKVFDPTQFVQPSLFNRTAIFGDTYTKNVLTFVKSAGAIDSAAVSQWAVLENKDRSYIARGFLSQAFGSQSIKNKSPSIFFNGLPAPAFPDHAIGYRIRRIAPTGFDYLKLGNPNVIKTPELKPNGLAATGFGLQWVSNYTRQIQNNSKDHSSAGVPVVWFRFRYVTPVSWQSSRFSLAATLTHGVREVIGRGFIQQGYGNAWVSRGIRLVQPSSIYKEYPSSHFVGRHQQISPLGFIATKFGTRIIPDAQALYPLGFAGVFGIANIDLSIRHLKPKGYSTAGSQEALRWGWHTVYNKTQYIFQEFDGNNGLVPPKWSDWTAVENRNKTIGAIGTLMQRFGYATIATNARLLEPLGLVATKFSKPLIAYSIRRLPLQGIEAPAMSDWFVIHNAARVIKPKGEVQTTFGDADVFNNRRYYRSVGRIESFESGTPMIAYRIRNLEIEKRYSIAPPIIRLPTIDLHTRYIGFQGYETAKYGLASLSIHFRIITPRWDHKEKLGYPALKNVTPELLTRGHDSQEYGDTNIRTQWRNVDAQGDNTALIGLHKISDTKQYISVRGFIDSLASQKHTVTQGESAPYSLQYIYLNDENNSNSNEGKGIRSPGMGVPAFNQNVIYPRSSGASSRFGTQFIWGNNLVIESGIAIDNVSNELSVRNKNNIISLTGRGIENKIELGKPRLSPHTIYAVKEAPAQAKQNHPTPKLHYVGETDQHAAGEVFGKAFIESTIRSIKPYWLQPSSNNSIGRPSLDLHLKVVRPNGFRLGRFGVPSIPFTRQDIVVRAGIYASAFGSTSVKRPPYIGPQYIDMQSIYNTVFGSTYADNYVRTLSAKGVDSLAIGMSKQNDSPFMWQGLRVGEYIPLVIGAGETSRYGDTIIGLRVREIAAEGFNAFISEYTLSAFDQRMNVSNADKKLPATIIIKPNAIKPMSVAGNQDIKLGQHFIRPDGNSDQFRKGGHHA